jgi:hypothetical protein
MQQSTTAAEKIHVRRVALSSLSIAFLLAGIGVASRMLWRRRNEMKEASPPPVPVTSEGGA